MANREFIKVSADSFRELITTGDIIEIRHEGIVVRVIVTKVEDLGCNYTNRLIEMSSIPNINPSLLETSRCKLEGRCIGDVQILGFINNRWQNINKCLVDRFTNTVELIPIDCSNQKQFEDFYELTYGCS